MGRLNSSRGRAGSTQTEKHSTDTRRKFFQTGYKAIEKWKLGPTSVTSRGMAHEVVGNARGKATLVNEVTLGMNGFRNGDSTGTQAELAPNLRSTVGYTAGQFNCRGPVPAIYLPNNEEFAASQKERIDCRAVCWRLPAS